MKKIILTFSFFVIFALDGISSEQSLNYESSPSFVLFPIQKSTISAQVDADIVKYPFREGEKFKEGDVIVQLDDTLYNDYYNSAKSSLNKAQKSLEYTGKLYEQSLDMFKKNGLSLQELEKSKLDYELAKSELEQAAAAMKTAETKLLFCSIKAPFSGSVRNNCKNEYEYVKVGEPVIEILNDRELLAVMNLSSTDFNEVSKWRNKNFYIDELKKSYPGIIYEISADINPGSRTFEVKFLLDNSKGELKAGMSGHLADK